ncbi:MAG: class I SAM-dependent methyltransferase [Bacteroidia bacterium]|nr:class I SAM-dependent methyltransferase [Bacteroidia bacterium]
MNDSPWLDISPEEYEAHMSAPHVRQWQALDRILAEAFAELQPQTLLIAGCGPGTGWRHIDPAVTHEVTGIDIHAGYLERIRRDHGQRLSGLELICGDILAMEPPRKTYGVVVAALLFEYIDTRRGLRRLQESLHDEGTLLIVLQAAGTKPSVSETPYDSIRRLADVMQIVSPEKFLAIAIEEGLVCRRRCVVPLPGEKTFLVFYLSKAVREERR